jgi:uncharacterized protein involved in exopolysaccharide biosynthesis
MDGRLAADQVRADPPDRGRADRLAPSRHIYKSARNRFSEVGPVNASDRSTTERDEELSLIVFWRLMSRYRYLIWAITGVSAVAALIYAFIATPIYRGEMVITEARQGGMGATAASAAASSLSELASMAGVTLPESDAAGREAQAVLRSRHLAEEFIKRNQLVSELLAHSRQPRTLWRAVERFRKKVVSFHDDKRRGTTMVAIDWSDPTVAARWANGFVALANEIIRTRALDDATRNIAYLNDHIARTTVLEIQRVMYKLIENETKTQMLASGRVEYAFTSVDPAVPPELRASPQRTLIVLGSVVLGLVIGCVVAFLHNMARGNGRLPQGRP